MGQLTIHLRHSFVARAAVSIIDRTGALLHVAETELSHNPLADIPKTARLAFPRFISEDKLKLFHSGVLQLNCQLEVYMDDGKPRILSFRLALPPLSATSAKSELHAGALLLISADKAGLTLISHPDLFLSYRKSDRRF